MLPDLKIRLASLASAADRAGFKKLAHILAKFLCERSPDAHHQWNADTRSPVADLTVQSIAAQQQSAEELSEEAQDRLKALPLVKEAIPGVKENDTELLAAQGVGGLETHDEEVAVEEPAGVLWSLFRLCADQQALKSYFMRLNPKALRDGRDWQEFKREHLAPFWQTFTNAFGPVYNQAIWQLAVLAGRAYRCDLIRFDPSAVYTRAGEFYDSCGIGRSVTFSTSSGLPNPMERHGTDWFVDRYALDPNAEVTRNLVLKNPFRTQNFSEGVLDPRFQCERQYVWEKGGTAKAFQESYASLPPEKRDLFVSDAVEILAECLAFERLRMVETESFDSWMSRLTRSGPSCMMISFRGPKSKKITHAVHLNFSKAERVHRFYQLMLGSAGAATSLAALAGPGGALAMLCWGVLALEGAAYSTLVSDVFKKGIDWGFVQTPGLRIIKEFGVRGQTDLERRRLAEHEIRRLLDAPIEKSL